MAEPKQVSLELPPYITRHIPLWQSPAWLEANLWRRVVKNQPIAGLCQQNIIRDLQGTQFEIRPRDPSAKDELAEDIEHYTNVVNPEFQGALSGFDIWVDLMAKDLLGIPIGGNTEVVRYPDGFGPLSRPTPKGHVAWIAYIDGATLSPTFDKEFPIMQTLPENITERVFFERNQIARTVMDARVDMRRWGYGMPPPERVYLAIEMLFRSDAYYANLLLDTPEAGILDLGDMSKESAQQWLTSFRELLTGIDPFKIPILYEHTTSASYIAFNRPPTELLLDTQTLKYSQITTAAYGLTITDINLGDPQKTLAGSIRDERRSRRSGYGTIKEKIKNLIDTEILPDYLEFVWIDNDPETKIQNSRAFLLSAQALEKAKGLRAVTAEEAQAILIAEGHITIEVEKPEEAPPFPMLPASTNGQQAQDELDRVPPGEGGRGDVQGQSVQRGPTVGDPTITAAPTDAPPFDQLAAVFRQSFSEMMQRAGRPRLMRLIKAATRRMFPDAEKALIELSDIEAGYWYDERLKMWFGEPSEFDDFAEVKKASEETLDELDDILEKDPWWKISPDEAAILFILKTAFEQGATLAAEEIQEFLFTEGLRDNPSIIGLSFDLKNPRTLAQLESKAAQLVRRVNDGTKFFLKRIITAGVDEGLSSPNIAEMIRDGASANAILREGGFTNPVIERALQEVSAMSDNRLASIVNTEVARAETDGRLAQWTEQGLTKKQWVHTGPDVPCPFCQANIDAGFVPIDFMYTSVFGTADINGPPAHPTVDHCHIEFSEDELLEKAGELKIWEGD